jgi:hypothetical protein
MSQRQGSLTCREVLNAAKSSGLYVSPHEFASVASGPNVGGMEHDVHEDTANNRFYKFTKGDHFGQNKDIHEYLTRHEIANELWPSLGYKFHGITQSPFTGDTQSVMSMNRIEGTHPEQHEIHDWFKSSGFEPHGGEAVSGTGQSLGQWSWRDPNTGTVISDTHTKNFIKTSKGLVPIDVDITPGPGYKIGNKDKKIVHNKRHTVEISPSMNAFCPTGKGGGQDSHCSPSSKNLEIHGAGIVRLEINPSKVGLRNWLNQLPRGTELRGLLYKGNVYIWEGREGETEIYHEDVGRALTGSNLLSQKKRFVVHIRDGEINVSTYEQKKADEGIREWANSNGITINAFCPTGKGGGQDATCSPTSKGTGQQQQAPTIPVKSGMKDVPKSGFIKKAFKTARNIVRSFNAKLDALKNEVGWLPVIKQVNAASAFTKRVTQAFYKGLETRYGRKVAISIMASGQALGWAAMAKGIYLPLVSVWGSIPAAGVAEIMLQAAKGAKAFKKASSVAFNASIPTFNADVIVANGVEVPVIGGPIDIDALAQQMIKTIGNAYLKWIEDNKDELLSAMSGMEDSQDVPTENAFCPTGKGGNVDPHCSPSTKGKGAVQQSKDEAHPDVGKVATPEEWKAALKKAKQKLKTVTPPTKEELQAAQEGVARLGANMYRKNLSGNSNDRRKRRNQLLAEFGDGKVCPCVYCGIKVGHGTMEQDKIITTAKGGRYRVNNLVPACSGCNKHRSDKPFDEVIKKIKVGE